MIKFFLKTMFFIAFLILIFAVALVGVVLGSVSATGF